jgi:hypothetical protein
MGYTHGTKWTNELIEEAIEGVMIGLGTTTMPTKSECDHVTGNSALSSKISRDGGFSYWADKLGLEIKDSETQTGFKAEIEAKELIEKETGLVSKITKSRCPYDILVNGNVKIEVKISNGCGGSNGFFYSANLYDGIQKADILIFICKNEEKEGKILVIPSHHLQGITQLSIGIESYYDKYKERYDYIEKFNNFMSGI